MTIYDEETFHLFRNAMLANEFVKIMGKSFAIVEIKQGFNHGLPFRKGFNAHVRLEEVIYDPA